MAERIQMNTGETGAEVPEATHIENSMGSEENADRPEWLPEKFDSPEDMAAAYGELEGRMGTESQTEHQETDAEGSDEAYGDLSYDNIAPYSDEFFETGELSDDSFKKLEDDLGVPQDIARAYVEGQRALVDQAKHTVFNEVGGQESYEDMVNWASENYTEEEISSFDNAVDSGDMNMTMMAVRGLHARYAQSTGTPANLIQGTTGGNATSGFASWPQVSAAMRDPRYAKDPAYRKEIENRLSVSNLSQ